MSTKKVDVSLSDIKKVCVVFQDDVYEWLVRDAEKRVTTPTSNLRRLAVEAMRADQEAKS